MNALDDEGLVATVRRAIESGDERAALVALAGERSAWPSPGALAELLELATRRGMAVLAFTLLERGAPATFESLLAAVASADAAIADQLYRRLTTTDVELERLREALEGVEALAVLAHRIEREAKKRRAAPDAAAEEQWASEHPISKAQLNAFLAASDADDVGRVRKMLADGLDPNGVNGDLAILTCAVMDGRVELVRALLDAGASVEPPGGMSPLLYATLKGPPELVALLLSRGADVERRDPQGATPLHRSLGSLEICRLLLESGADANALDGDGEAPLETLQGCPKTVELLLKFGARLPKGTTREDRLARAVKEQAELEEAMKGAMGMFSALGGLFGAKGLSDQAARIQAAMDEQSDDDET